MNRIIILPALLVLAACQAQSTQPPDPIKQSSNKIVENSSQSTVADQFLISANGIGKAKLGMTLKELKQVVEPNTEFELVSPFLVDANAIAVSQDGLVQYYLLYPAGSTSHPDGSTPTDNDPITILITDNQKYQTEQGVKVGTYISQAEDIYGDAILAYNVEGESREYITFGRENPPNISFRASYFKLISDGLGFSGIYPEYPGVSYTTDKYQDGAAIAAIEVACDLDSCL